MTLRVTLSIVPFGNEDNIYEIGKLDIYNVGPTLLQWDASSVTYLYRVLNQSSGDEGLYEKEIHHRREDGAWKLVQKVLTDLDITGPKQ